MSLKQLQKNDELYNTRSV